MKSGSSDSLNGWIAPVVLSAAQQRMRTPFLSRHFVLCHLASVTLLTKTLPTENAMLLLRKNLTSRLSPWGTAFTSSSSSSSVYRLLSTPPTHGEPPSRTTTTTTTTTTSSEFAVQYLINSCGLPSDKAVRAARYISHLKSPHKPDAVLQFLRQAGITEPHIRAAALRDARFLCCNLDKFLKPRVAQLQEIGFSPSHLSLLLSICPLVFQFPNLQERVKFWIPTFFGSVEKLLALLKQNYFLLSINPKTSSAKITFLQEQCGLSIHQIAQLIMYVPRLITSSHEFLKISVKRAEDLGVSRSSQMFIYALKVVSSLNPSIIEARLRHLRSLGFSQVEVTALVGRFPLVLTMPELLISRKMEFLMEEAGCDKLYVLQTPCLLTCSLEKRLLPRNLVWKLLELKGLQVANKKFASLVTPSEVRFVEKFVLPYENIIPGLHQAYKDVCAGNTSTINWFKSICS